MTARPDPSCLPRLWLLEKYTQKSSRDKSEVGRWPGLAANSKSVDLAQASTGNSGSPTQNRAIMLRLESLASEAWSTRTQRPGLRPSGPLGATEADSEPESDAAASTRVGFKPPGPADAKSGPGGRGPGFPGRGLRIWPPPPPRRPSHESPWH